MDAAATVAVYPSEYRYVLDSGPIQHNADKILIVYAIGQNPPYVIDWPESSYIYAIGQNQIYISRQREGTHNTLCYNLHDGWLRH